MQIIRIRAHNVVSEGIQRLAARVRIISRIMVNGRAAATPDSMLRVLRAAARPFTPRGTTLRKADRATDGALCRALNNTAHRD